MTNLELFTLWSKALTGVPSTDLKFLQTQETFQMCKENPIQLFVTKLNSYSLIKIRIIQKNTRITSEFNDKKQT